MCIVFLALGVHPAFPFILASNRDELFERPTRLAGFWPDFPFILAGRDELRGGTWLGVTRSGRFAVLTNFRVHENVQHPSASSRGLLVEELLASPLSVAAFLKELEGKQNSYEGFNLLAGEIKSGEAYYFSNTSQRTARLLEPGIYALSNATLTSNWYKTAHGKEMFRQVLTNNATPAFAPLSAALMNLLQDDSRPQPHEKWERGPGSTQLEDLCAPIRVFSKELAYGTRTSTVIAATSGNRLHFQERSLREPPGPATCNMLYEMDLV